MKNSRIFQLSVVILVAGLLSGCSTLRNTAPLAVVEPPTPIRKDNLRWEMLKNAPTLTHEVSPDASARPPNLNPVNDRNVDSAQQWLTSLNYSFFDNFEVGFSGLGFGGLQARGILWKSNSQGTDSTHLLVLNASLLGQNLSKVGDQNGELGPGGHPWKAKTSSSSRNMGLSYGYLTGEDRLLYFGLAYNHFENENTIQHSIGGGGTSPAAEYFANSSGNSRTLSAGFQFGKITQLKLGASVSQVSWGQLEKTHSSIDFGISRSFEDVFTGPPKEYDLKPKSKWTGSDFGGLALSYLFGFGTGQAVQGNWS